MTKEELAQELDGCEYPLTVSKQLAAQAKGSNLVIVYGASDDLMEFEGAIDDEIGAYNGVTAILLDGQFLDMDGECESNCKWWQKAKTDAKERGAKIEAVWCPDKKTSWAYKTKIPHAVFRIMEEDEVYCRGIVFDLKDA